jgi:hypothetical protein
MHTQIDTAALITGADGDYVMTARRNTPTLHAACKALLWKHIPAHTYFDTSRGRRVRRTIKVTTVPAWIDFPGAAQIAQLRRTRTVTTTVNGTRKTTTTVEVVYVITSADHHAAPPTTLAAWVQGHWSVENTLHHVNPRELHQAGEKGAGGLVRWPSK